MTHPYRFLPDRWTFPLLLLAIITAFAAPSLQAKPPAKPTPIMPLSQVHQGMTGYGLTVFNGAKIQAFPVRIVSVVSNGYGSPRRSVIWIQCKSKRLQRSGPIEGMSGSPIFLWPKGAKHVLGKNGLLIGAFAFGYSLSKGCLAGVQPIQYMRKIPRDIARSTKSTQSARTGSNLGLKMLDIVQSMVDRQPPDAPRPLLLNPLRRLLNGGHLPKQNNPDWSNSNAPPPGPYGDSVGVHPLMLPMNVGSASTARLLAPLFKPFNINPVATGGGLVAGKPPARVNPNKVKLVPGAALVIPLAYGDLDLCAGGTVTDVLPNGTVLGFGHPMFDQGHEAVPMATGYVNFVVPALTSSFKVMGSLKIHGSVVQDESTGIAGIMKRRFSAAPVTITVNYPHQPKQVFHYHVVNHAGLTSTLAAAVAIQSITARQGLPEENTLRLRGTLGFTGHRNLHLNTLMPAASGNAAVFELIPIITTMMDNPYQRLKLTHINLTADVSPTIKLASITNARMNKTVVAPGKSITLTIQLQPYGKTTTYRTVHIHIPPQLPEGDYHLTICGANTYMQLFVAHHPYLLQAQTVDDIYHTLKKLLQIKTNDIYCSLTLPHPGLAVGRAALPMLPSSVAALIAAPTNTYATAFKQSQVAKLKTHMAIVGSLRFVVHVRKHPGRSDQSAASNDNDS